MREGVCVCFFFNIGPYGTVRREGSTHTASTSYHDRPYGKKKEGQKQSSSE